MAHGETATGNSIPAAGRDVDDNASLALAFVAADPQRSPRRIHLGGAERIEITRGTPEGWERADHGRRVIIRLDDRYASEHHAELSRREGGFTVEDRGSKNGTRRNGRLVDQAPLVDGDTLECGGTFMVLRTGRVGSNTGDLEAPVGPHPLLRTLHAPFQHELELLAKMARADVPLLIRGETGTGKEVAARAVHDLSRREGPFVAVNCGGIPPSLLASELFGTLRGAYSGATKDRDGLVRAAHGGTLFLDEIAELAPEGQTALLRVLQDSEVLPLGATRPVKVNLRVIAATHQPLDVLTADRRFRLDLLSRLRGYQFFLPPLAERREDLGLLIATLLERVAPGRRWRFRRSAARVLFRHAWPMHVRELEHALRAAVAIAGDDEIAAEDLPETVRVVDEDTARDGPRRAPDEEGTDPRARLAELVARHHGNVSHIAEQMATSRAHVRRLARRFGIDLGKARTK